MTNIVTFTKGNTNIVGIMTTPDSKFVAYATGATEKEIMDKIDQLVESNKKFDYELLNK